MIKSRRTEQTGKTCTIRGGDEKRNKIAGEEVGGMRRFRGIE
jgi:hypothetical protein